MNICYSGGAKGSDKFWGQIAEVLGHEVIHYSFEKHGVSVPKRFVKKLTQEELDEATPFLLKANKTIKRTFPTKSEYVDNLLKRNYWQIKNTKCVYAIADLDEEGIVYGGTSWAVQMAIDKEIEVYLYSQATNSWYNFIYGFFGNDWLPIDSPPLPEGKWTGIGTKYLTEETKQYIIKWINDKTMLGKC